MQKRAVEAANSPISFSLNFPSFETRQFSSPSRMVLAFLSETALSLSISCMAIILS